MSKLSWAVAVVMAAGLATTVEGAPAGFRPSGETAHLTFYSRGDVKVDAKGSEKRLQQIAQQLGQSAVPRTDCYRYERAEDVAAATGQYAGGITYPALHEIHATEGALDHELVHLVADQLGDPGSFFHEGLAVALGDRGRLGGRKVDDLARPLGRKLALRTLLARFAPQDHLEHYAVAGSFVAWLIQHYGIERVASFFRACPTADRDTAFQVVFGQTFDESGAAWAAQL